jgi:hypothetical protein
MVMRSTNGWLGLGLAAVAALAIGCSDSGSGGGKASSGATGGTGSGGSTVVATQPPVGSWLKGDLHVHTRYSPDADRLGDDVSESIRIAEYAGLDYVVLGDHRDNAILNDPQLTGTVTPLTVIPGMEWGGGGHAGAHGMSQPPTHMSQTGSTGADRVASIQQTIAEVQSAGGFFVLNHSMDPKNPWVYPTTGYDGIEIWNQLWSMRRVTDLTVQDAHDEAQAKGVQAPPEMLHGAGYAGGGSNYQALKRWEYLLDQGEQLACVGGGDRHYLVLPGEPTTLVFARDRSQASIVEGIRGGRTMVARGTNAPVVEFTADGDGDGVYESYIGDAVPLNVPIAFRLRVTDAQGGFAVVYKNGQEILRQTITNLDETFTFSDTALARSWYRVDVFEPLDLSNSDLRMLRQLVMGTAGGSLSNLMSSSIVNILGSWVQNLLNDVQDIVATGAPAAVWLLVNGQSLGVQMASGAGSRYPVLTWPEEVSRVLNVDLLNPDFCRGVITSPIWAK